MKPENETSQSSRSISITIIGLLFMMLAMQACSNQGMFDKAMAKAASELNEICPMMVDNETRLDNAVVLPGYIFQYNYTLVNLKKSDLDIEGFTNYLRPTVVNNVRTNPDLKIFRDNKVTMAYYYKDMNGEFIAKIEITPAEYEN